MKILCGLDAPKGCRAVLLKDSVGDHLVELYLFGGSKRLRYLVHGEIVSTAAELSSTTAFSLSRYVRRFDDALRLAPAVIRQMVLDEIDKREREIRVYKEYCDGQEIQGSA